MAVRLLHPAVSPHLFRGARQVYFEGVLCDVLNAQGESLLDDGPVDPTPVAPILTGGALELDDGDLVLVAPTVTRGHPAPVLQLVSLTRDGADVRGTLQSGRIPDAPSGDYVAVWSASNGIGSAASRMASLTVAAAPTTLISASTIITPTTLIRGQF